MSLNLALDGVDHVLIGVWGLEEAHHAYLRLGFQVTPRGRHIGWGTANYCVMFPDDYIELIGVVDAKQDTNGLADFLSRGAGGLGLAFRGHDLDKIAKLLEDQGVAVDGPNNLKRILELPEGEARPAFELLRYDSQVTPGVSSFICRHKTPEIVWQAPWLDHPNGATGIHRVVTVVSDPGDVAVGYGTFFGEEAVAVGDGYVEVAVGDSYHLRFLSPEDFLHHYPGETLPEQRGLPCMAALHLWIDSIAATRAYFDQYNITYRREGDQRLLIPSQDAGGIILAFDTKPEGG